MQEIIDLGYVVGDDVDWPDLEAEVAAHGPLTGAALQRLAIATMTGLAALHRAGIVHGAVRPDTVLLGPNGPRLRHPARGASRPAPLDLDEATVDAGTLTWSTPEELKGLPAQRPGDLFGWAATMAFAATGSSPFGDGGSTTTRVNRLLHGAADLGPLEGVLRDLVADCLAAEPAERPAAEDALLRLIGYSGALDSALPSEPEVAADRPTRRLTPRIIALVAAGVAVALVSGGVTYLITQDRPQPRPAPAVSTAVADSPASTPAVSTAVAAGPTPTPVPQTTRRIALPNGGTLYEHPADPIKLGTLRIGEADQRSAVYARVPGSDTFERGRGPNVSAEISPDGRWLAVVNELYFSVSDRQEAVFTDRRTGARFSLPVAAAPDVAQFPQWSRDSRKLLLSVMRNDVEQHVPFTQGFVMLDVEARTSTFVPTSEPEQTKDNPNAPTYKWTPDGTGVAGFYTTPESAMGLRFRDLTGRVTRSMHWVGHVVGEEWFSPSGRMFVTTSCPRAPICVWDTATGQRRATVPGPAKQYMIGWWDDTHLVNGVWTGKNTLRLTVVDLKGKQTRVLADVKSDERRLPSVSFTKG
ncbi:hypothetical protein ABZ897_24180 [Nonomuraea sp. NPDC046802]|uniref:protein kinase domain-containing protein n=1 Tax=Nonomuraea sp. NPDC046802 TaxID=3154919 RepID=UPI00340F9B74